MANIYEPAWRPDGSGLKLYFRVDDAVDYWEGVVPAPEIADVDPA